MYLAIISCVFIINSVAVNSAPATDNKSSAESQLPEVLRVKRANYGPAYSAPSYGHSQCGAVAPAPYHMNAAPHAPAPSYGYAHALPAPYAGYGVPHYRSEDFGEDLDTFGEMDHEDHLSQMRSYGGYASAGSSHAGQINAAPAALGPAMGLFTGVSTGGCNVPLLLSCSPSVVPGRLIKTASHYGAPAPAPQMIPHGVPAVPLPAYRGVEPLKDAHAEEHHMHSQSLDHHDAAPQANRPGSNKN